MYFMSHDLTASSLYAVLPLPDYLDPRFAFNKGEQLIFDNGQNGSHTENSDRFRDWDEEGCARAVAKVRGLPHTKATGLYWQTWLEGYHDAPVRLHKIYACTNMSGYPIWRFNYDVVEKREFPDKETRQKLAKEYYGKYFEGETNEK